MTIPTEVDNLEWKRPKGHKAGHCPEVAVVPGGLIAIRSSGRPNQIAVFDKREWALLQQVIWDRAAASKKSGKRPQQDPNHISSTEAGQLIGVSGATARRWADRGFIPVKRLGDGQRRYDKALILQLIAEGKL